MNFYQEAAKVLDRVDAKKGSIKGIIGSLPDKSRKRTAALVIETLKYKDPLAAVIGASSLLKQERKHLSDNLALLLVHDLLLARGGIQASDGPIKQAVTRHKTRLQAELVKLKIKRGVKTNQELASEGDSRASQIPRYVRVNTIRWTLEEALVYLSSQNFLNAASPGSKGSFVVDKHIPGLLAFHPATPFHKEPAYLDGRLILQDKASCFPAFVLSSGTDGDSVALDATAAPGNKTTHLSALMQNKGKILAFERDRARFSTLQKMVAKAGCKNIQMYNVDFLSTTPQDAQFAQVTHMLLDPSCSGSGIVNRLDYLTGADQEEADEQEARFDKLSSFQLSMIKHAMTFPSVQRIVYSTCSIHAAENEHVVVKALDSEEARRAGFSLATRDQVLPTWERRGLAEEMGDDAELADCVVRCSPGDDHTNGFFVSCFVRNPPTDSTSEKRTTKRKANGTEPEDGSDGGLNHQKADGNLRRKKKGKKKSRTL
ncbi:S-adenosyl-L-methionine-dependent methyltransferase [Hysterangium stoloniferum]|nr:S-adenosyl-L-methionine-dependent methyltransferase [Hysterangium stoloniferum]